MTDINEELYLALRALRAAFAETVNFDADKLDHMDVKRADKALQAVQDAQLGKGPLPTRIARLGDMGQDLKLELMVDGDGDIYVSVMPKSYRFTEHCVEFCTPGFGGGKSPATFAALQALRVAMDEDNKNHATGRVEPHT